MTVIRGTARSAPGCHNVCGILSYVKDGKLVKVEGDPEDPYNQGRLCSRCLCIPDYVYHEDRLVKPMKRDRADRGKDKFVECSWDEAYDIIVREFKRVVDTYGADKIAMCQGTGRDIHQVTRLNACVGSPNEGVPYFAGNSCYLPRIASMACMLGGACVMDCSQFLPQRYDDPRYTVPKYCIVWGHQPFYSNADGFYGHWITDLMKRGMKVAVIDPQLTWLAARAGEDWLRVRPGGDGALAMAMLKVVCDEKLYDQEFCDKWVYGLEAVCERVAEMDLDDLCEKSWVCQGGRAARRPHLRRVEARRHPVGRGAGPADGRPAGRARHHGPVVHHRQPRRARRQRHGRRVLGHRAAELDRHLGLGRAHDRGGAVQAHRRGALPHVRRGLQEPVLQRHHRGVAARRGAHPRGLHRDEQLPGHHGRAGGAAAGMVQADRLHRGVRTCS